ncbi:MAG: hypothetical protein KGD66_02740 [Candidatus Lokiarchaeota archaeon]|nr:hypothetical protein [Candidatus Lokiarchaeota archaeon]
MPEDDNEKIEDFMSLWKNKNEQQNNNPSIIGDTLNQMEILRKENQDLRNKISENIALITKTEDIINFFSTEKERLKVEKEEAIMDLTLRVSNLENENLELGKKVKSMVKLLLEKDDEIKRLESIGVTVISPPPTNDLANELHLTINQRNLHILTLEKQITELTTKNEELNAQIAEKIKTMPIDHVAPVNPPEETIIKPLPPEGHSLPLESLCQDLQADLNKYKKIIEKLTQEKSQLKGLMENQGIGLDIADIKVLKSENENLKHDVLELQKSLKVQSKESLQELANAEAERKIKELQGKIQEKETLIADMKLSQGIQATRPTGPMSDLVEELQKSINKLKLSLKEKDQKIQNLNRMLTST